MKKVLRHSVIACLLLLCAANGRAELSSRTHDFDAMRQGTPTLNWTKSPDYTYGEATIPPVLAYQGASGGTYAVLSKVVFRLASNGSTMQTLSAVDDLTKFAIGRTPDNADNLKFYISSDDGEHWTQVTDGITVNKYSIEVQLPSKGSYLIKVERTGSTVIDILKVTYYTDPCNCLRVVTE